MFYERAGNVPSCQAHLGKRWPFYSKRYVRALKRRPVKVLYSDSETFPTSKQVRSNRHKQSQTVVSKMRDARNGKASSTPEHTTNLKDQLVGLKFERAVPGDKRLARVVSVARSRTFLEHQGKILLEGRHLICNTLAAGLPLDELKRATLVKVKLEDIKIWSDLVMPKGVMAIFSLPDPSRLTFPQVQRGQSVPLSLICDSVREPGHHPALCCRCRLPQCWVDSWEPKVLRAAMGAHFRLPVFPSLDWDDIQNHRPNCKDMHYEEYQSDSKLSLPRAETKLYHEGWAQGNTGLVIGGETHGLSLEAVQLAERTAGQ
uniref:tRNA/rRNA methyltransferase SpoU type domain-containing protein n=1 Tax=Salmo trutta TaxID=8032 RepID=A0A674CJG0_SALTR